MQTDYFLFALFSFLFCFSILPCYFPSSPPIQLSNFIVLTHDYYFFNMKYAMLISSDSHCKIISLTWMLLGKEGWPQQWKYTTHPHPPPGRKTALTRAPLPLTSHKSVELRQFCGDGNTLGSGENLGNQEIYINHSNQSKGSHPLSWDRILWGCTKMQILTHNHIGTRSK